MNWTENYSSLAADHIQHKMPHLSLGAPQIHQHWSLLKASEISSILHWHFLDPCGPNIYEHFHIFQLASWSIADIPHSQAACCSLGILLLIFPRVWCWFHVSHAELQVWCKYELNTQMHFSSGAYYSQVALFRHLSPFLPLCLNISLWNSLGFSIMCWR